MSESLWDPTRLTNLKLSPDPMPVIRENISGAVFSPEFGGLTANVEFEALTGFSNAFLPTGSIPYQQYVRDPIPSLATFFRGEGYTARAIHPFAGWFWNRTSVYKSFGFETFRTEETMPVMQKRGIFTSDESLTKEIIRQADAQQDPFFFFAVTLQGHGPYEANRYAKNTIKVEGNLPYADRQVAVDLCARREGGRRQPEDADGLGEEPRPRDDHRRLRRPPAAAEHRLHGDRLHEGRHRRPPRLGRADEAASTKRRSSSGPTRPASRRTSARSARRCCPTTS